MDKPVYERKCEGRYPHARDVLERQFSENGFASGWMMHAKPVPKYHFDCHIHYDGAKDKPIKEKIKIPAAQAAAAGVERAALIVQTYGEKRRPPAGDNAEKKFRDYHVSELKDAVAGLTDEKKIFWGPYLRYNSPEPAIVRAAADLGAAFVKLHNAPQIEENAPPDLWLSNEWRETFNAIAERGLPVLWHVTQRLPSSVYTGGGRNTYWTKGWENGVTYTNEDLLQIFLTVCRRFPKINFIGAHQLHIGWDRLDDLFTGYPNLHVDSTIGCQLRPYDDFYAHDKEYLRQMFVRRADKILYGTDTFWGAEGGDMSADVVLQHMRFIQKLDLDENVLENVCHLNAERLMGIHRL